MKRILLFSLLIGLTVSSFAQSQPNTISVSLKDFRNSITRQLGESGIPYANVPIISNNRSSERLRGSATQIGFTTYDEQPSNQRLFPGPGGSLSATWTGSKVIETNPSNPTPWPDRGTFYNYFDGTNWFFNQPNLDSVKIEIGPFRTGFPSNVITDSGEWMCSHIPTDTMLATMTRPIAGSGNWTVTTPSTIDIMWPHATAYGNNIYVIGADNRNTEANKTADATDYLTFSRSEDGGKTWDILDTRLPEEDSTDCINYVIPDAYAIDAYKNTVAIVAGGLDNGVFLWKSTDYGSTWIRSTIDTFPTSSCGGEDSLSVFNYPVNVTDGNFAVLVDNNGKVHVWYDDLYITKGKTGDTIQIYYPTTKFGLEYWNDGMAPNASQLLATVLDTANTGYGSTEIYASYSSSFTAMPTVTLDTTTNTIYCVFSEAVPGTQEDGSGITVPGRDPTCHSFRDLFGVYTKDGGTTWSQQADLTFSATIVGNPLENVYPAAAKTVAAAQRANQVDVIWMQDGTPGTYLISPSLNQDGINDIMYQSFTMSDFNGFAGVKNINGVTYSGLDVYPNPANMIANLNVAGLANEKAYITVTNLVGETVKTYNNVQLTGNIQMNTANLANGIYIVKVETITHILTGKISVAH